MQEKFYEEISKMLDLPVSSISENSKILDEINAVYYYNPSRGGKCYIVSNDGSYLGATSSVSFEKLLEEFKTGRRNGNINFK